MKITTLKFLPHTDKRPSDGPHADHYIDTLFTSIQKPAKIKYKKADTASFCSAVRQMLINQVLIQKKKNVTSLQMQQLKPLPFEI